MCIGDTAATETCHDAPPSPRKCASGCAQRSNRDRTPHTALVQNRRQRSGIHVRIRCPPSPRTLGSPGTSCEQIPAFVLSLSRQNDSPQAQDCCGTPAPYVGLLLDPASYPAPSRWLLVPRICFFAFPSRTTSHQPPQNRAMYKGIVKKQVIDKERLEGDRSWSKTTQS